MEVLVHVTPRCLGFPGTGPDGGVLSSILSAGMGPPNQTRPAVFMRGRTTPRGYCNLAAALAWGEVRGQIG
jgi:hypothetical protein